MNTAMKERVVAGTLMALIVMALLLGLALVYKLSALLFLVLIASVLTMGMDRPARWLQTRLHFPRALAIIAVMLLAAVVALAVISVLVVTAVTQAIQFAHSTWPRLQSDLLRFGSSLHEHYSFIPDPEGLWEKLRAQSGEVAGYVWSTTRAVFGVLGSVVSIATIVILTFFFAISLDGITRNFARFLPPPHRAHILNVTHLIGQKMGAWARGQLTLAIIIAVIVFIGMAALGVPYSALIASLGGLGEMIPMVGPYTAFIPTLIIVLVVGAPLWKIIAVIVFFVALIQMEGLVLAPKVMQKAVELAPVTTVMSLIIGGALYGIVGALLSVPVAAGGRVFLHEVVFPAIERVGKPATEASGP